MIIYKYINTKTKIKKKRKMFTKEKMYRIIKLERQTN